MALVFGIGLVIHIPGFHNNMSIFALSIDNSSRIIFAVYRGGLALLFWGGVMAVKGPVERGQALNGYSHLDTF